MESGERRAESRESGESVAPPDFDLPHPSRHPPPSSLLPPLWNLPVYFHFLSLCYLPRCRLRRAMPTPLQPWIHHKAWRATKGRTNPVFLPTFHLFGRTLTRRWALKFIPVSRSADAMRWRQSTGVCTAAHGSGARGFGARIHARTSETMGRCQSTGKGVPHRLVVLEAVEPAHDLPCRSFLFSVNAMRGERRAAKR